jgi:hypothetical protein
MDYSSLQNMSYNQIVDKGIAMSIVRQARSTLGVSTGAYTTTSTTYSCYGVRLNFKKKDHQEGTVIENSLQGMQAIEANSVLFLIAAKNLTITPDRKDRVVFSGTTYEIEEVEQLSPNGTNIIYKIKARK